MTASSAAFSSAWTAPFKPGDEQLPLQYQPHIELDIDGYIDRHGIRYIGKAIKQLDGKWLALADVEGRLCRVEVSISPATTERI